MADNLASSKSSALPYQCRVCKKRFRRLNFLQAHMRMHTGHRPYRCDSCSLTFITQCQLRDHQHKSHPDRRPYRCPTCKLGFVRVSELNWHMFREHRTINLNTVKATSPVRIGKDSVMQASNVKSISGLTFQNSECKDASSDGNTEKPDVKGIKELGQDSSRQVLCEHIQSSSDNVPAFEGKRSAIERLKAYRPQFSKKMEEHNSNSLLLQSQEVGKRGNSSQSQSDIKSLTSNNDELSQVSGVPKTWFPSENNRKPLLRSKRLLQKNDSSSPMTGEESRPDVCQEESLTASSGSEQIHSLPSPCSPSQIKILAQAENHQNHDHNKNYFDSVKNSNCFVGKKVDIPGSCHQGERDKDSMSISSNAAEDKVDDPLLVRSTGLQHHTCDSKPFSPQSCNSSSPASPASSRGPNSPRQLVLSQASPHSYLDMVTCGSSSKQHQSPSSMGQSPYGFSSCDRPREAMSVSMSTVGNSPSAYSIESAEIGDGKVPSPSQYVSGSESLSTAGSPYSVADKGTGISPQYFENQLNQLGPSGSAPDWKPAEKPIQPTPKPNGNGGFNFLNEFAKFVQNFDSAAINSVAVQGESSTLSLSKPPVLTPEEDPHKSNLGNRMLHKKLRPRSTFYISKQARKIRKKCLEPRKGTRVSPRFQKLSTSATLAKDVSSEISVSQCLMENAVAHVPDKSCKKKKMKSGRVGRPRKKEKLEKRELMKINFVSDTNLQPNVIDSSVPSRLEKRRNSVSPPELEPVDFCFQRKNKRYKASRHSVKRKDNSGRESRTSGDKSSSMKRRRASSDSNPPRLPMMVRSGSTESSASSAPPQLTREEPSKASVYDFEDMSSEDHLPPPKLKLKLSPRRSSGWESTLKPPSLNMFKRSLSDPNGNSSLAMPNLDAKPSSPRSPRSPRVPSNENWQNCSHEMLINSLGKPISPRTLDRGFNYPASRGARSPASSSRHLNKCSPRTPPKDGYIPTVKLRRRNSSGHYVVVNECEMEFNDYQGGSDTGLEVGAAGKRLAATPEKKTSRSLFQPPLPTARKSKSPENRVGLLSKSPVVVLTKSPDEKLSKTSTLPNKSSLSEPPTFQNSSKSAVSNSSNSPQSEYSLLPKSKLPVVCLPKTPCKDSLVVSEVCKSKSPPGKSPRSVSKSLRKSCLKSVQYTGKCNKSVPKGTEMKTKLSISELLGTLKGDWSKSEDCSKVLDDPGDAVDGNTCNLTESGQTDGTNLSVSPNMTNDSECLSDPPVNVKRDPKFLDQIAKASDVQDVATKLPHEQNLSVKDKERQKKNPKQNVNVDPDLMGINESRGQQSCRNHLAPVCKVKNSLTNRECLGVGKEKIPGNKSVNSKNEILLRSVRLNADEISKASEKLPENELMDSQIIDGKASTLLLKNVHEVKAGEPVDIEDTGKPSKKGTPEKDCLKDAGHTSDGLSNKVGNPGLTDIIIVCKKVDGDGNKVKNILIEKGTTTSKHKSLTAKKVCAVEVEDILAKEKSSKAVSSSLQKEKATEQTRAVDCHDSLSVKIKMEPIPPDYPSGDNMDSIPSEPVQNVHVAKPCTGHESLPNGQVPSVEGKYSLRPKRKRHPWDVTCECCVNAVSRRTKRRSGVKSFVQNANKVSALRHRVCLLLKTLFPELVYPVRFNSDTHAVELLVDKIIQAAGEEDSSSSDSDMDCDVSSENVVMWEPQVVLCKSPRRCLLQLRRKVCRLLEVLLPDISLDHGFDQHGEIVDDLLDRVIDENSEQSRFGIPLLNNGSVDQGVPETKDTVSMVSGEVIDNTMESGVIGLHLTSATTAVPLKGRTRAQKRTGSNGLLQVERDGPTEPSLDS